MPLAVGLLCTQSCTVRDVECGGRIRLAVCAREQRGSDVCTRVIGCVVRCAPFRRLRWQSTGNSGQGPLISLCRCALVVALVWCEGGRSSAAVCCAASPCCARRAVWSCRAADLAQRTAVWVCVWTAAGLWCVACGAIVWCDCVVRSCWCDRVGAIASSAAPRVSSFGVCLSLLWQVHQGRWPLLVSFEILE